MRLRLRVYALGAWLLLIGWLLGWLLAVPPYGVAVVTIFYTIVAVVVDRKDRRPW